MGALLGPILSMLGPLIVWGIKMFVKEQEARETMVKNYYQFLAQIDKKSATKVANYLASERELSHLQLEIMEKELVEPGRPTAQVVLRHYEVPEIEEVDVEAKIHGQYITDTREPKGLVVHYTAGRFSKGREDAINTLRDLCKRGLACLVMDTEGRLYRAKNQSLSDIGWHAGESKWKGKEGISRFCLGMEICCAGKIEDKGSKTWWGDNIHESLVRKVPGKENMKRGSYHKYTEAQEKSLINFILWQLDTNSQFSIDWVVGHDEISPDRKSDPGGSLSMTMPSFRAMIRDKYVNMTT